MKLTTFLLLVSVFGVLANKSYSQTLSLKMKETTLKEVLSKIEDISGYNFLYSEKFIDVQRKVSVNVENKELDEVLKSLFSDINIDFERKDRIIILSQNTGASVQQQKTITGKVTDSSGQPLPGVSVVVKGTTQGIITDNNGNYSLANVPADATLVYSFVGMKAQEIPVSGKSSVNVTMKEETVGIEEVVAIGYGSMKKNDLTGSITTIDNDEINMRAITSISQGLQGNVAGVQVTQPSGRPGGLPFVRIRGANSIQYGNDPLWVIDGFPVASEASYVNPNDIETITVLKDASATAIYGSRGANGVILVTTKRGKEGKTIVSFDSYYGFQEVVKKIDLMNAQEWAPMHRLFWERFRNGVYITRAFTPEQIAQMGEGTDWQDEIFRTGAIQSYDLSFSGGDQKTKFNISGNYLNQEGIVINSKYSKGTVRINLDHEANDKLKFGMNFVTAYEYRRVISENASINNSGVIHGALIYAPTSPVKNEDGTYFSQQEQWVNERIYTNINIQNPVQVAYEQASNSNSTSVLGNFFTTYEIIEGLTAKISLGGNINHNRSNSYIPSYFISQSASKGTASVSASQRLEWINENIIEYNKTFNDLHSITALVGLTAQEATVENLSAGSSDFFTDVTKYYDLSIGSKPAIPSSNFYRWSMLSYLGRINYNYADKLLLTFSTRYDGSSRFGKNNRFGLFPSGALAWRINQEKFLEDVDWLSNLKIRISYGKTGNQDIPLYQNILTFSKITSYVFNGQPSTAMRPRALINPDLKWESTHQYDIGTDIGLFDNKLLYN